ncbi:SDR family oxidoreductase [Aquincola sp. S2]|uniref:SDR family oxidoreductase n=1 Tax=Pseudaquabacterium terrae TaxID=2732868 RepID=A0ABX2EAR2_9BURK|nr:SDR family oxidoreductase [Aquabacterium terrae]NRF65940.1 SDR family oxidoreductase [Aquabacterium terrae]
MNAIDNTTPKTVLITGCSSGIGRAAAHRFAQAGWRVAATMRNTGDAGDLAELPNVLVHALDVTDQASVKAAIDATLARFGRIDAVINNAGFGLFGPFETASDAVIERQFNTNVFGVFNVIRAVLPALRSQGGGVIVNVASVGGLTTLPFNSLYHATKYAVVGFTEGLNHELAQFGIRAKFVAPGGVSTDFAGRSLSVTFADQNHPYAASVAKAMEAWGSRRGGYATPAQTAEAIFTAATDDTAQVRYVCGADAESLLATRAKLDDAGYLQLVRQSFGLDAQSAT